MSNTVKKKDYTSLYLNGKNPFLRSISLKKKKKN